MRVGGIRVDGIRVGIGTGKRTVLGQNFVELPQGAERTVLRASGTPVGHVLLTRRRHLSTRWCDNYLDAHRRYDLLPMSQGRTNAVVADGVSAKPHSQACLISLC
jgi:hypothetical protein